MLRVIEMTINGKDYQTAVDERESLLTPCAGWVLPQ